MPRHETVPVEVRLYIYRQHRQGVPLRALAEELGYAYETVRKWWRRGRDGGEEALMRDRRGRPARGPLSTFPEALRQRVQELKERYPRWGPDRIRVALQQEASQWGGRVPRRSQIALFLRQTCPHLVRRQRRREPPPSTCSGPRAP